MNVLRASFTETRRTVDSPTGRILIRPYQVVVPIHLVVGGQLSLEFPAIIDTGNNLNLSISESHLKDWVRMDLKTIGQATMNGVPVRLKRADLSLGGRTLVLHEGIAVHDVRLPVLGLRALVKNRLNLSINSVKMTATIKTSWI